MIYVNWHADLYPTWWDLDGMKLKTGKISRERFNVINGMSGVECNYCKKNGSCLGIFFMAIRNECSSPPESS